MLSVQSSVLISVKTDNTHGVLHILKLLESVLDFEGVLRLQVILCPTTPK
ncbi:hypothetical protein CCP3SC1_2290001 [Gammaproteobacteria bacterium]